MMMMAATTTAMATGVDSDDDAAIHATRTHTRARLAKSSACSGDISDRRAVARLFDGISSGADVIHTAGVIHPKSLSEFTKVNANGTRYMVEVAQSASIRRMVHVSSNSPFGTNPVESETFRNQEPYNPYLGYGASKMQGELAVLAGVEYLSAYGAALGRSEG